jgi:sterol desaturase/sphingolipid hydroxylase (fatty acid hydroxylase superfamily)
MSGALRDTAMAAALLAAVFGPLEWAFPANPRQGWRRPRLALDAAFFVGNYLVWGTLAVAALDALSGPLGEWVPIGWRAGFGRQPWWLQAIAVVALGDLGIYWFHRACHAWAPLWRVHRVHHSAEHLDWVAAHREHPLDGLLSQLVLNLPALALGFSVEVVGTFFVFRGLWSIFIHSNCRLPLGPLRYLLGAPEVHAWHHAKNPGRVANFANLAPWCDLLFGTYHCPSPEQTWELGVPEPMPAGYLGLLVEPFVRPQVASRARMFLARVASALLPERSNTARCLETEPRRALSRSANDARLSRAHARTNFWG